MDALSNAYSQRGRMKPLCYGFISIALSEVNYLNVGVSPRCVLIRGSQVEIPVACSLNLYHPSDWTLGLYRCA